jgi:hypothetical protein
MARRQGAMTRCFPAERGGEGSAVFAATRERRDRSCVGRPPSLLIRGRCIRRSARSAPVGCCTEPHESPSKRRAPEPARARGVTSPGWHAPNECLHLRGAADYAGKYQGLEEHAQAGRRRGFRWHDLRRMSANSHRQAGTATYALQRLGGWKTQSMAERYAHLAPEGLQTAGNRLDAVIGL